MVENKAAKAKYLSKSLVKLWAAADAHTPKGDVGPVDFDPVTNSQEPDVKSFEAVAEKLEVNTAVIAVTIASRNPLPIKRADNVIRYNFVREGGQWKIDDISGSSDGEPWSVRDLLTDSLKEVTEDIRRKMPSDGLKASVQAPICQKSRSTLLPTLFKRA